MAVLLFSSDLMTTSRVEGAGARTNVELKIVGGMDPALECISAGDVSLVLIDLTSVSLDIARLVAEARSGDGGGPSIIAFGPHVQKDRLIAAREAGCEEVLTRGQFFADLDAVLARATQ